MFSHENKSRLIKDTGAQTLEIIAKADKFNRWMYETIRPYCYDNILEIGSGIGNISQFFIRDKYSIILSDTDDHYVTQLKKKFNGIPILPIDLTHENFNKQYASFFQSFDTLVFFNVLEHVKNDILAIENCRHFLKPGGRLIILVPAYSFLFSKMDKELQHYRRYTSKKLVALVSKKRFTVKKVFYFNALGIVAWLYGKFFGLHFIPEKKMKMYNHLVPMARWIDKILFRKAGLSVIIVAQKDL